MSLKYTRNKAYVTTIMGVHFFPGTHIADITDKKKAEILQSDVYAFEAKTEGIIVDEGSLSDAAKDGTVSKKELETVVASIDAELAELDKALAEAKKKKTATAEIKAEIEEKQKELADAEKALATRIAELKAAEEE